MGRRARTSSLFLTLVSSACTLFTELDGFSGGQRGVDPSDANAGGVAEDADRGDGGGPPAGDGDTGGDGRDANGTATGFCARLPRRPTFCADFDTGGPVAQGWDAVVGGIVRDDTLASSRPSSARATATTGGTSAYVRKDLSGRPTRARFEVDVRIDNLRPDNVNVVRLHIGGSILFLRMTGEGAFFGHDNPSGYTHRSLPAYPPAARWFRVGIVAEVGAPVDGGTAATASMTFDGTVVAQRAIVIEEAINGVAVLVGVVPGKTIGADANVRYDNVVVELD